MADGRDDEVVRATLAGLWRAEAPTRRRPGPKPRVSLDGIVEEAVALADASGLDALSMRAVGDRLGTTGMALYSHVPTKAALIALMVDHVHAELPTGDDADPDRPWRATLEAWAETALAVHLRHPWLSRTPHVHAPVGPHSLAAVDHLAAEVQRIPLAGDRARALINALFHLARGTADAIAETRQPATGEGTSDADRWAAQAAVLAELVPDLPGRFPGLARLDADAPPELDPVETFLERRSLAAYRTGVAMLLDGATPEG